MDTQRIDAALRQASDTRRVVIEAGALGAVDETFAQCFENAPAVVVADDNTFAAAGRAVQERLSAAGRTLEPPIVFPGAPALYERVLQRDMRALDIDGLCRAWPSRETVERMVRQGHDIPQLAENAVEESLAKYITPEQLRERLELIQVRWPDIRTKLEAQLMTAIQLRDLLAAAGCPTDPAAIGIDMATLRESYWLARTIRSRYTVLDLVYETGLLEECVGELFGPEGYWAR